MKIARARRRFFAALAGVAGVAVCCFTPVLVVVFAAVGLSAFTPYLDYVLYPALATMVVVAVWAYFKWRRGCAREACRRQGEGDGADASAHDKALPERAASAQKAEEDGASL